MFFSRAKSVAEEPIERLWKLDWKIASGIHGDCYRGVKRDTKDTGLVWVTHSALTSEQGAQFLAHLKALTATRVVTASQFGVDSLGQGYVVLSGASGKGLQYDQPDTATLRRRFLACVLIVAEIHAQGYACGNITDGSFVVGEDEKVIFIGACGGYSLDSIERVPSEVQKFLVPGTVSVAEPEPLCDVYALSVLGLSLFGAQFPPEGISSESLTASLEALPEDVPSWATSVLTQILKQPDQAGFKDAGQLLSAITIRERTVPGTSDGAQLGAPEAPEQDIVSRRAATSPLALAGNALQPYSRIFALGASLIVLVVLGIFAFGNKGQNNFLGALNRRGGTAKENIQGAPIQANRAQEMVEAGFRNLSNAQRFSQANDIGSRKDVVEQILENARAQGASGGAQFVQQMLAAHAGFLDQQASSAGALLEFLNPALSPAERRGVLERYSAGQRELSAIGAAAIVFDKPEEGAEYRDLLLSYLRAVAPTYVDDRSASYSTEALAIATDINNVFPQATESPAIEKVTDRELWWLLHLHANKKSRKLQALASMAQTRQLAEWPRSLYLRAIHESADDGSAPYEQLVTSAERGASTEAVQSYASWYGAASELALYVALLENQNAAYKKLALDALLNKPHANSVVSPLMDRIRMYDANALIEFGSVIGAVGLGESIPQQRWGEYLKPLHGSIFLSPVSEVVFAHGSTGLIRGFLGQFGRDINPGLLLPLLRHPEVSVRKEVIPLVKALPLASSRAVLESARDDERAAEVLETYRAELPGL